MSRETDPFSFCQYKYDDWVNLVSAQSVEIEILSKTWKILIASFAKGVLSYSRERDFFYLKR